MLRLVIYILLFVPLVISCQQKYNAPPYDKEEMRLREHNVKDTSLIISKDWEKRDSLSYLRFKYARHITIFQTDTVPRWINRFKEARVLTTYKCDRVYLPENIGDLSELEKLILSESDSNIPSSIKKMSKLTCLTITGKASDTIPKWISELNNLETLLLDNFNCVPDEIFELESLKILWLVNCNITYLPSSINRLKQLEILDINTNPLDSLPQQIFELPKLRKIHYDKEKIKDEQLKKRLEELVRNNDEKYWKKEHEKMDNQN